MKNKAFFLAMMMFLISGVAGVNTYLLRDSIPQKQGNLLQDSSNPANLLAINEKVEGWGFVKSKKGSFPGVTAHQWELVRRYDALFIGDREKKKVTITFDLGYEKEGLTPRILEVLGKTKVQASFFTTTHWIKTNPELAKQVITAGHLLGNHTVRHKSLPTLSDDEVRQEIIGWEEVAQEVLSYQPKYKYMRPPMGEYSARTLQITKELGYITAFWSIAIRDWLPMGGSQAAVDGIISQIHNGAVILLHGNSEDVVGGLEEIINQIRAKGIEIVPINEIE